MCDHGKASRAPEVASEIIRPYRVQALGNNYRLSELHAAFARSQLSKLGELCHVHPLFAEQAGRATAPAYRFRDGMPSPLYGWGTLPVAEKIAGELPILPVHPALSE